MYSRSSQLQLPLSSDDDAQVRDTEVITRSGMKWSASSSVSEAKSSFQLKDVIGNTYISRQGIGLSEFKEWNKAQGKERRDMVLGEVRQEEEQIRRSKAKELGTTKTPDILFTAVETGTSKDFLLAPVSQCTILFHRLQTCIPRPDRRPIMSPMRRPRHNCTHFVRM